MLTYCISIVIAPFLQAVSTCADVSVCSVRILTLFALDINSSCLSHVTVDHNSVMQVRPKRRAPITQVLMVGGATRMPAFKRFVRNMTGLEAKGATVDPDEVLLPAVMAKRLKYFTSYAVAHNARSSMA